MSYFGNNTEDRIDNGIRMIMWPLDKYLKSRCRQMHELLLHGLEQFGP